jgi:diaminohydroxyphosphoribosylaminopyrimidine deaminase/5-amino-6-(5-phosphoribosylamino)uracil reductase
MSEGEISSTDETYMTRALDLAVEGWGQVAPNPMVGAVLVSGDRVVGTGYHAKFGAPHAEVMALREGTAHAGGATLYVTLEPCSHRGKTAPCTDAIRDAGVRRVVFAHRDPDSQAGGGEGILRDAGVDVCRGVCALAAARLNAPFLWQRLGKGPWISLKLALSLDGRISAREGQRTDVSGGEAAEYVHRLRAGHDAVMVGGRTAVVDDPLLTVRLGSSPRVPPTRVVLDPGLALSPSSRLARTTDEAPLLIVCREGAPADLRAGLERQGAMVSQVAHHQGVLDLSAVMGVLEERGLRSVMLEGGGRLAAALLSGGWVRRQYLIYAPVVFGPEGVPSIGSGAGLAQDWRVVGRTALGPDSLLELEDRRTRDVLMEAA